jgi:hypothetical protein
VVIELQLDSRQAERAIANGLRKLDKIGRDVRPILRGLRGLVVADQRDHRRKQEGPDGKWPKRAASTIARYKQMRKAGRKPPRGLLGRLPAAFRVRYERATLVLESIVKWSLAHQKGLGVPEREYYWVSRQLLRNIRNAVTHELAKAAP